MEKFVNLVKNLFESFIDYTTQDINLIHVFNDYNGFNIVFTKKDEVFGAGSNSYGCLGLGHNEVVETAEKINELKSKNIQQFFHGFDFMLGLSDNNQVYSWGNNDWGQLGWGYSSDGINKPGQINFFKQLNIAHLSCGSYHSLALTSDGVVYGWGDNSKGQIGCGLNETDSIELPVKIMQDVISIYCASNQSFALTFDGVLYSWGHNIACNLGYDIEKGEIVDVPRRVNIENVIDACPTFKSTYFLTSEGSIYFCGRFVNNENEETFQSKPIPLEIDINFESISWIPCCQRFSDNPTVLAKNAIYLIRNNNIEKTEYNSYNDYYAQEYNMTLGTMNLDDYLPEVRRLFLKNLLSVHLTNKFKYIVRAEKITKISSILYKLRPLFNREIKIFHIFDDLQGYVIFFITKNDNVFGFGINCCGSFGFGETRNVNSPQLIKDVCFKNIQQFVHGFGFVIALNDQNQIYGWGRNDRGQVAQPPISNTEFKPEMIQYFNDKCIVQLSCGSSHALALSKDGLVYGWGDNSLGQIGCGKIENNPFIYSPRMLDKLSNTQIKSIHCSFDRSFAVSSDGLVFSWGQNNWNTLGYDVKKDGIVFEPKLIDIQNISTVCATNKNAYFLSNEGSVYFCGVYYNEKDEECYQLNPRLIKTQLKLDSIHSIPFYQKWEAIATALLGNTVFYLKYNQIRKTKYKNYFDFYANEYKMTYQSINLENCDNDINELSFDNLLLYHTQDRSVKKWTFNSNFSNGLEFFRVFDKIDSKYISHIKKFHIFDDIKGTNVVFITSDDTVFGFGSNNYGVLGFGHNKPVKEPQIIRELGKQNIQEFSYGFGFGFARNKKNEIFGWGCNVTGILGQGDNYSTSEYCKPVRVKINLTKDEYIVQICCGGCHTLALSSEGVVYGWGGNNFGQVGIGNYQDEFILLPTKLNSLKHKIKSIFCSIVRSFALTIDGLVYSWGYNNNGLGYDIDKDMNIHEPKLINLVNVVNICPDYYNTYFQTNEGLIYFCGKFLNEENQEKYQLLPKVLEMEKKFESIHSIPYYQGMKAIVTGLTENKICLFEQGRIKETEVTNYFLFYALACQMTYKMINLNDFKLDLEESSVIIEKFKKGKFLGKTMTNFEFHELEMK